MASSKSSNTTNNSMSVDTHTNEQIEKTTMQSLYELIGLHYYKTRSVFDVDGKELVYVSDNMFGRMKMFLNGEEIYKGWTCLPGMISDVSAHYQGHEYRVFSRVNNWVTWSQKITLIVDDKHAQSRVDPVLGGLKGKQFFHALAGPFILGGLVGLSVGFFSS